MPIMPNYFEHARVSGGLVDPFELGGAGCLNEVFSALMGRRVLVEVVEMTDPGLYWVATLSDDAWLIEVNDIRTEFEAKPYAAYMLRSKQQVRDFITSMIALSGDLTG